MSYLFLRGRSVWIGFSDSLGVPRQKPTGFKLDRVVRRSEKVVWPRYVLDFKLRLDSTIALGEFGLKKTSAKPMRISEGLELLHRLEPARKPSTKSNDRLAVKKLIAEIGDVKIGQVSEEVLIEVRAHWLRKHPASTVAMFLRHLGTLFSFLQGKSLLPTSPLTRRVRLNPPKRVPRIWSELDLQLLFSVVDQENNRLADQLRFLLLSGFRSGEACALKWKQVDLKAGIIRHRNEKEDRFEAYPIDGELRELLDRLPKKFEPWVFKYRNVTTVSHYLKRFVIRLGLDPDLTVHDLKRTYISRLVNSGASEGQVHVLAHHKSFQTTLDYYTSFNVGTLRETLAKSRTKSPDLKVQESKN